MNFHSIYHQGFARVAALSTPVHLGDPKANAEEVLAAARSCHANAVSVAVFPQLTLTGYTADDLFQQEQLLNEVADALTLVVNESKDLFPILVVGAPLVFAQRLYNCAVLIHRGKILGVTPKTYLPSYREFYEKRYFASGTDPLRFATWNNSLLEAEFDAAGSFPFGSFQVRASDVPGFSLAAEIGEDLTVPIPPSSVAALRGATILANLSASPQTVGQNQTQVTLSQTHSSATLSAYIYASAGFGESSTDLSWGGETIVCEAGTVLAHEKNFFMEPSTSVVDVDLRLLTHERLTQNTFGDNATLLGFETAPAVVTVSLNPDGNDNGVRRKIARNPFIPHEDTGFDGVDGAFAEEVLDIQVSALARRILAIGTQKLIIGVSGGLDSTLALLVAVKAMDLLNRPRTDVVGYTMPGFGTSTTTRNNAEKLALTLGITFHELDIRPAAEAMLAAMDHPFAKGKKKYDVTFENVQAGLRTDYLFRLAGSQRGIVVGTGDLSELALGWCTFGVGDHMSHYGVNGGIPKTLIQYVLRWVSEHGTYSDQLKQVLQSILNTEISPELVPQEAGAVQSTQAQIGPYELQDFTLYYLLRHGFTPKRIAYLQEAAWGDKYSPQEILHWLEVFHRRFFTSQFKRSTLPNGPKVMAGGSLSPRGDWRMPSDAVSAAWLREIEYLKERQLAARAPSNEDAE